MYHGITIFLDMHHDIIIFLRHVHVVLWLLFLSQTWSTLNPMISEYSNLFVGFLYTFPNLLVIRLKASAKLINIIIIISVCIQTKVSIRECSSKLIVVERVWCLKLKVQFIIWNHMSSVWDFSELSVVRCVLSTFFPSITHSEKHEPNCQPVSQSLHKPTQILCKHTENLSSFTVSFVSHAIQGS